MAKTPNKTRQIEMPIDYGFTLKGDLVTVPSKIIATPFQAEALDLFAPKPTPTPAIEAEGGR